MEFEAAFQYADQALQQVRGKEGLRDVELGVLEGAWHRQTYGAIARRIDYTEGYLSRDVGPKLWQDLSRALGRRVTKTTFRTAIQRYAQDHPLPHLAGDPTRNPTGAAGPQAGAQRPRGDDGAAAAEPLTLGEDWGRCRVDVTGFQGRAPDLNQLQQWVLAERPGVIGLVGIPEVGKTWLVARFLQQIQGKGRIDRVVYRDLSDRPSAIALVRELLTGLRQPYPPAAPWDLLLRLLVSTLAHRCYVLVFDGTEHLLQPHTWAGTWASDVGPYGGLLEQLQQQAHRSCVLWVGREVPDRLMAPGERGRCHRLEGMPASLGTASVTPPLTEQDWRRLHRGYGGVPPLLQAMVAQRSQLGQGLSLTYWLEQWPPLRDYLQRWLQPLSPPEWTLLTTLVLDGSAPVSADPTPAALPEGADWAAARSLCHRGCCRPGNVPGAPLRLALAQPLRAYLCQRWVAQFHGGDDARWLNLLHRYPLIGAGGAGGDRPWRQDHLLIPVAAALARHLAPGERLRWIQRGLDWSRSLGCPSPGYSAGNLINLAQVWQLPLTALNCRDVVLRGADLHSDRWQGVDVRGADLGQTHLHHPLGRSPVCALSGSGHTIAVGDQDGHLLAWQTTGVPLGTGLHLEAPSAVTAIALNPPGDTLVEGRQDGRVHLWALPHPYGPDPLPSASEVAITALIFGPGDQWIAGGDEDGHLLLWQVASGTCRYRQSGHSTGIVAIAASPCGQFLLSADRAGNVVEWQVSTGRVRDRFNGRVNSHLGSIGYLPQGTGTGARAIALGTDEGRITIWDIASGTPWRILPGQCDLPLASCISPNGQHAAMADLRGQVYLWDLEQCRPLAAAQAASPVTDLAFSPEGAHLLWASDYQVQLHQPLRGDRRQTWSSQYPLAIALATTATPQPHLLSLHPDGTLRGWRSRSSGHWHLEHRLTLPQGATGRHLLIGPQNHHWLVITTTAIYRWQTDTQTWQPVPLPLGRAPLTAYALDARETWLALGDDQGTVTLWHLPSGRRHHTFTAHDRAISAIAFSPNGDQLACGSYDHHLSGWTIDGQPLWRLAGHQRHIHTLIYGTDHTLVSGSWDGTIRHWDLRRTVETHCWDVAQPLIYGVTLDPAGHALALVGTEHTLEVWESQSQTCRHRMTVAAALWQVAPSPDGQLLLGASQGGDITLWDLTTGDRRGQLRVDRPYEGLNIQGCRGLTPTEREHLYALGAVEYDSAPPPMSPMSSA